MLKQNIKYVDFFDKEHEEDLYFNISKSEIADNLWLIERFENLQKVFEGGERKLTVPEIQLIIELVKDFMKLSYGERSEDGRHFRKSTAMFEEFRNSAMYDAMLIGMFENPQKMFDFILGVLPQDWRQKAEAEVSGRPFPQDHKPKKTVETVEGTVLSSVPDPDEAPSNVVPEVEMSEFLAWKASQEKKSD